MAYPPYIPTRSISIGGAGVLEDPGKLLKMRVTVKASRPLIWYDTGYQWQSMSKTVEGAEGQEVEITLPTTDATGWAYRNPSTGDVSLLDVSAPGSYTHEYKITVDYLTDKGAATGLKQYDSGWFVLPQGDGSTVDLDTLLPVSTVAGAQVAIPDTWSAMSAAAVVEQVTLTAPLIYTLPAGTPSGIIHRVVFTQDATGGHTVTYGGGSVSVGLAPNAATTVEFVPTGSGYVVRYPNPTPAPLAGKRVVVIGDSNVELTTWTTLVATATGATVTNCGIGGTRLAFSSSADYDKFSGTKLADAIATGVWTTQLAAAANLEPGDPGTTATVEALAAVNWATVDHLVVAFGTNDFEASIPVGTVVDSGSTTIRGAVNYIISTLLAAHPTLRLSFLTPTWRARQAPGDGKNADTYPNGSGEWMWQHANAIIETAAARSIPVLDLFRSSGINAQTAATYLLDGLHLNAAGSARVAESVARFLVAPTASTVNPVRLGQYNIGVGDSVHLAPPTGQYNTGFGTNAQKQLTTGQYNTASGLNAQQNLTEGSDNTAGGYAASRSLTTGTKNVHLGSGAGYQPGGLTANATTTANGQVVVGYRAGAGSATQVDNIVAVGQSSTVSATRGVSIGSGANTAHADSVALGANVATTAVAQVRIGPRHIEMTEVTAPGVAPTNGARLYVKDNGAGKTQLVVIFQSGAEIVLATEA